MQNVRPIDSNQTARISLHAIAISKSSRNENNPSRHFVSATSCPSPWFFGPPRNPPAAGGALDTSPRGGAQAKSAGM
jgi:hypothetical protein